MLEPYRFVFTEASVRAVVTPFLGHASVVPDLRFFAGDGATADPAERWAPGAEAPFAVRLGDGAEATSEISDIEAQAGPGSPPTQTNPPHPRLALIVHAYLVTPALLTRIAQTLDLCDPNAVVFTTDTHEKRAEIETFLESRVPASTAFTQVLVRPNRGRDIGPFWPALEAIAPHADVFLKVHWKATAHLEQHYPQPDGRPATLVWNDDLFDTVLPSSRGELEQLLDLFAAQRLGCVFPRAWPPLKAVNWEQPSNLRHAAHLLHALQLPPSALQLPLIFPAGNMFYGSVPLFRSFAAHVSRNVAIPEEPVPTSGTILHALERSYTALAAARGLDVAVLFPESKAATSTSTLRMPPRRPIVVLPVAELLSPTGDTALASDRSLPYLFAAAMSAARPEAPPAGPLDRVRRWMRRLWARGLGRTP